MYYETMIGLFKQIPTMKYKTLSQSENIQLLLTDIGGAWYMKKLVRSYQHFKKHKLSKKAQDKYDKIKRNLHTANRNWNH